MYEISAPVDIEFFFLFFQVWTKRGVTEDDLFLWVERLRKVRKINTCTLYVYKY